MSNIGNFVEDGNVSKIFFISFYVIILVTLAGRDTWTIEIKLL
jgi:hypothetical protein